MLQYKTNTKLRLTWAIKDSGKSRNAWFALLLLCFSFALVFVALILLCELSGWFTFSSCFLHCLEKKKLLKQCHFIEIRFKGFLKLFYYWASINLYKTFSSMKKHCLNRIYADTNFFKRLEIKIQTKWSSYLMESV